MMTRKLPILLIALMIAATVFGCGKGSDSSGSVPVDASPPRSANKPTPHTFEDDLKYVRDGGFTHVWVVSRKDGRVVDKDDGAFLRTNATQVVDWVLTQDGKKAIGGTNFDLELGNLDLLKKRFVVEDYTGK